MSEEQNTKPYYKKWWFWVVVIIAIFILIGAFSDDDSEQATTGNSQTNQQETTNNTEISSQSFVDTGEEGVLNATPENCKNTIFVAPDREAFDAFAEVRANGSEEEIQNTIVREGIFGVFDCTRVSVTDSAGTLGSQRQVEVLEGGNQGKTGWVPVEWIQHEAPEMSEVQVEMELPEYEVLRNVRTPGGGGFTGDVLIEAYSMNTPFEELSEAAEAIAEKEGLDTGVYFYATREAYRANMGEDIPGALENGLLGSVDDGNFEASFYYEDTN